MLTLLLTTVLTVAPTGLLGQDQAPTEEQVAAAVATLEEAFKKGESDERIAALQAGAKVLDAEVIDWIGKGLRDRDTEVQKAAIESLRFMAHPEALAELHASYKRDKKLLKNDELSGALLKAIGQHGSETSIAVLSDSPFSIRTHAAIQARILGLGNIRTNESVEELMAMMAKVGRRKAQPYMDDFRLALVRLTGSDNGKSVELWFDWWNDTKKTLKVSKEPPSMRDLDQRRWDSYWGIQRKRKRDKQRGDDDGERDGK